MSDNRPSEAPGTEHSLKALLLGALVVFLVVGALVALVFLNARLEDRRLRTLVVQKLAALKAQGLPVTAEEVARLYPDPPASEDAGQLLAPAFNALVGAWSGNLPFVSGAALPKGAAPMDAAMKEDAKAFVAANAFALQSLPEEWPANARFASGFSQGFPRNLAPPLVKIRMLLQTLAVDAVYQAETGNAHGAARSLLNGFRVSQMLPGGLLVNYMIHRAGHSLTGEALQRTLNRVALSDAQLADLSRALETARTNSIASALAVERCQAIWAFEEVRAQRNLKELIPTDELTLLAAVRRFLRLSPPIYSEADYLRSLRLMDDFAAAMRLPAGERLKRVDELQQRANRERQTLVGSMLLPNWSRAIRVDAEIAARLLLAHTALAVERYRLAHADQLPDTLGSLVPGLLPVVPTDPFDGQSLRYKKVERGYLIYSVGADGLDDGGVEKPPNPSSEQRYDLPFRVER